MVYHEYGYNSLFDLNQHSDEGKIIFWSKLNFKESKPTVQKSITDCPTFELVSSNKTSSPDAWGFWNNATEPTIEWNHAHLIQCISLNAMTNCNYQPSLVDGETSCLHVEEDETMPKRGCNQGLYTQYDHQVFHLSNLPDDIPSTPPGEELFPNQDSMNNWEWNEILTSLGKYETCTKSIQSSSVVHGHCTSFELAANTNYTTAAHICRSLQEDCTISMAMVPDSHSSDAKNRWSNLENADDEGIVATDYQIKPICNLITTIPQDCTDIRISELWNRNDGLLDDSLKQKVSARAEVVFGDKDTLDIEVTNFCVAAGLGAETPMACTWTSGSETCQSAAACDAITIKNSEKNALNSSGSITEEICALFKFGKKDEDEIQCKFDTDTSDSPSCKINSKRSIAIFTAAWLYGMAFLF